MKKIGFTILYLLISGIYAQETFTIQTGKKTYGNAYSSDNYIVNNKLFYTYYESDNKTISHSMIDIGTWRVEKEGIKTEELCDGVTVADNLLAKIHLNTLTIYDGNYQAIASHEFTVEKGFSIIHSSYANDPEHNQVVFYVVVSNNTYGWSETKASGFFIYYDIASQKMDIKEINANVDGLSINGFLSNRVIDNKVVMDIYTKDVKWAIMDLSTGKFSGINFDKEAKYFDYNVLNLNNENYFIFRGGQSTSKSIFYFWDIIFKINMETGEANYIGTIGNKNNPISNVGLHTFSDDNAVRLSCGFIRIDKDKYVNFSLYDDKIRAVFIYGSEHKYIEIETLNVTAFDPLYYKFEDNQIRLIVDASKQIKSGMKVYTLDLENMEFVSEKDISKIEDGFGAYYPSRFYCDTERDVEISYTVVKDKKTGAVTFTKTN